MADLHPGLVTVVQRFRADAGLFVHLHTLATDGAFEALPGGGVRFHPATGLTDDDLRAVLDKVAADLAKAGLTDDVVDLDVQPALAACVQLSLSSPTPATQLDAARRLVARAHGMNLHAATVVDGRDRARLERLCKYLPVSSRAQRVGRFGSMVTVFRRRRASSARRASASRPPA